MLLLTPGGLHYTRCPLSYAVRVRVCLWVWAWVCVALGAGQGVGTRRGTTTTTLQDFPIAAEENYYSFNPDGTYTFSYDTGGGKHQSFRIEMRDASGRVSGRFGYVDPSGALRITEYQADSSGYRASIEVYHQVSLAPPAPLLVGPLPKQPPSIPDPPESPPQPPAMRPVGPAPFFPPEQPVLIVGPLPRPLQPQSIEVEEDPPDLDEDSLFTLPSDPLIPAVVPKRPPGEALPRGTLSSLPGSGGISILEGGLTDPLQHSADEPELSPNSAVTDVLKVPYDDLEVSQNSRFKPSSTPAENTDEHSESLHVVVGSTAQAGHSSNTQAGQQFPKRPNLLPAQNNSPVPHQEHRDIDQENTAANYVPGDTAPETHDNTATNSASEEANNSINSNFFQPSATSIITSTISKLEERGTKAGTAPAITASPVLATKENGDTRSQSKTFHSPRAIPPIPPQTYLPVGAPRHQYPTAPLLKLPQDPTSHPA